MPERTEADWEVLLKRFGDALIAHVPLLKPFTPAGWKDFRDGHPKEMRFGLFSNTEHLAMNRIQFKAMFGSRYAAMVASGQIERLIPRLVCYECCRVVRIVEERWHVEFSLFAGAMEEITEALAPQMNGK